MLSATSSGTPLAVSTTSTNQARYALSEDSCPKGGASCSGLGSGGCHSILAPRLHMASKNICQQAAQHKSWFGPSGKFNRSSSSLGGSQPPLLAQQRAESRALVCEGRESLRESRGRAQSALRPDRTPQIRSRDDVLRRSFAILERPVAEPNHAQRSKVAPLVPRRKGLHRHRDRLSGGETRLARGPTDCKETWGRPMGDQGLWRIRGHCLPGRKYGPRGQALGYGARLDDD